jgi:hypothetical protein
MVVAMVGCTSCWGGGGRRIRGDAVWAESRVRVVVVATGGAMCRRRDVPAAEAQGVGPLGY